jgi:hypothetical protein
LNREDIIRMAKEAGFTGYASLSDRLHEFAALVAKNRDDFWISQLDVEIHEAVLEEREALLDLVDGYAKNNTDLEDAIRARSNN